MADSNVQGKMEIETKNQGESSNSNDINANLNGKNSQNMIIFLSTVSFLKKIEKFEFPALMKESH